MTKKTKAVKKVVKVAKPSRKGILWLADILIANKRKYNQETFGTGVYKDGEVCGTVCCLAGLAYVGEIGSRKFNKLAKDGENYNTIADESLLAGKRLLNLPFEKKDGEEICPIIFSTLDAWPLDLRGEYHANGPKGRVVTALKALQRLHANGNIDKDPKAVITRIPQLKALLESQKTVKA